MTTDFWLLETQDEYESPCKVLTNPLQNHLKCLSFYTVTTVSADLKGTAYSYKLRHKGDQGF